MVRQPRPNKHHARSNAGCSVDVQGGERDVRQMRHPLCGMCVRKVRGMAGESKPGAARVQGLMIQGARATAL